MSTAPASLSDDHDLAEMAVLGAALFDNAWLEDLPTQLKATHFAVPVHARIWEQIQGITSSGQVPNVLSVYRALKGDPDLTVLGGVSYLNNLQKSDLAMVSPIESAAEVVRAAKVRWAREALHLALLEMERPDADPAAVLRQFSDSIEETTPAQKIEATPYLWRDPASIPPRPWVLGRWLLRGTTACVIAPGGVGKTTFLAASTVSMATGRPLLGKDVWGGRKRVWIWNLEDDLEELSRAIQAAALHYELTDLDLDGWLFVDSALDGRTLCTATMEDGGFRLLQPVYDKITAELKRRAIDVLVIDPFVSSHDVEENDNGRIDKVAKAWARVAKDASCVVILVHHASKNGSGEVTAMSSRGASSLVNAARSTLVLNRMDEAEAQRLGIAADERRRFIRVQDDKANRAPAEAADWFQLVGVELGNAADGMPSDSIAVVEPWKLPDPFDDVSVSDLREVQSRLGQSQWRESIQATAWVGNLVGEVLGVDVSDRAGKAKVKAIIKQWIKNGALRIEEAPDANRELRKFVVAGDLT